MPLIIIYLIKFSLSLAFVFLFYLIVLRRLTFYQANRWYFLGYCLFCLFIPFINIEPLVEHKALNGLQMINYIPLMVDHPVSDFKPILQTNIYTMSPWTIVFVILASGSLILMTRLMLQFFSLKKMRRKGVILYKAGSIIYHIEENIMPFSFGNAIYVNKTLHSASELENIILHEFVHVRQKHTLDILLAQWICIINWYNPFAWLTSHAIRQNLEFIADNEVLEKGLDKKSYQYHLLHVVGRPEYLITNSFNFSSLKKRIAMMNKLKSARLNLVRFLFILPLLAVLLIAFRDRYGEVFKNHQEMIINAAGIVIDLSTKKPVAGVMVKDSISGTSAFTDKNGFYTLTIQLRRDTGNIFIKFIKEGYKQNFAGHTILISGLHTHGLIDIIAMVSLKGFAPGAVSVGTMGFANFPDKPGYQDALKQLESVERANDDLRLFLKLQKDHPEVSLFYTSEYKTRQIVVYADGNVEKYGYPNGPSIADMEIKFGKLPDLMRKSSLDPPAGYLKKWERISAYAEKNFHTANPDVYAIIFPGDSRVIAVPKSGKAKIYDMDNSVPEERMLFEKLYGSLTGIVPPPGSNSNGFANDPIYKDWVIDGIQFLGFPAVTINREYSTTHFSGRGTLTINPRIAKGIIIYNGKEYEASAFYDKFGNSDFKFSDVFVYENKCAFERYGDKGRNGVILIENDPKFSTRVLNYNYLSGKKDTIPGDKKFVGVSISNEPVSMAYSDSGKNVFSDWKKNLFSDHGGNFKKVLFILDGREMDKSPLSKLYPGQIEAITVLKDSTAIRQYGSKGRNGVIIIRTKNIHENHDTAYRETVNVQNGMLDWQISKDYQRHPLILLDGKVIGRDPESIGIKPQALYIGEFTEIAGRTLLNKYGEGAREGIFNLVTKANRNNIDARIFAREIKYDASDLGNLIEQAAIKGILYLGIQNPLKISVEGIAGENLVVQMDKEFGVVSGCNGIFYISPKKPGNAEVNVYKKERNGSLKLLSTRYFRIAYLPDPFTVIHFSNS